MAKGQVPREEGGWASDTWVYGRMCGRRGILGLREVRAWTPESGCGADLESRFLDPGERRRMRAWTLGS